MSSSTFCNFGTDEMVSSDMLTTEADTPVATVRPTARVKSEQAMQTTARPNNNVVAFGDYGTDEKLKFQELSIIDPLLYYDYKLPISEELRALYSNPCFMAKSIANMDCCRQEENTSPNKDIKYETSDDAATDDSAVGKLVTSLSRKRSLTTESGDGQDDMYWEKRRKNNESAKRSRDCKRTKGEGTAMKVIALEQENCKIAAHNRMLRCQIERLKVACFGTQ